MKRILSVVLACLLILSSTIICANAVEESLAVTIGFNTEKALYVHGVLNSEDAQAWQGWQSQHTDNVSEKNPTVKYFFLPTSADKSRVDIYNGFSEAVEVNGVKIPEGKIGQVGYETDNEYKVVAEGQSYTLVFMRSNAEAGVYINNSDVDGNGTNLMTYLYTDKNKRATATGAIVEPDGSVNNTPIKKIKGRGNTTWQKSKKPFNITYESPVDIAGMGKCKKFSLLANYQDDSLSRNRFLYDLADAVGTPYASDSRYVDFYVNGYYWGSYQMCEKIEVGKNCLINDIDDKAYLNSDDTVNEDFPFLCEIDFGADESEDYVVDSDYCSGRIVIKSPELTPEDKGYNEVKKYVLDKFEKFYTALDKNSKELSDIADIDSIAKLYLINELGKNWDSGISSTYFVWKQDENGHYKFFGSPVWDYDNSLGNAVGDNEELNYYGVKDYKSYSGWWCKYKGVYDDYVYNTIALLARNKTVMEAANRVWFEKFVPALKDFYAVTHNGIMKSRDEYFSLLKDSARMNYTSGWLLYTSTWIARHSRLEPLTYLPEDNKVVSRGLVNYNSNFEGMFNFAVDWMESRAIWLSEQFKALNYSLGDIDMNKLVDINDATLIQKYIVSVEKLNSGQLYLADVNGDDKVDINDVTYMQKFFAGIYDDIYGKDLPENIDEDFKLYLRWEEENNTKINILTDNPGKIGEEIIAKYSDCNFIKKDYDKGYIAINLPSKSVYDISKKYGKRVFIEMYYERGIEDEQLLADLEKAQADDEFLVSIYLLSTGNVDKKVKDFIAEYLNGTDKYLSDYNGITVLLTKSQLEKLNENPNKYIIRYEIGHYLSSMYEYGIVNPDELDNSKEDDCLSLQIMLGDFDKEAFSYDAQYARIEEKLSEMEIEEYDYERGRGYVYVSKISKKQILSLLELNEKLYMYVFNSFD